VPVTIGQKAGNSFQVLSPMLERRFVLAVAQGTQVRVNVPVTAGVTLSTRAQQKGKERLRSDGRLAPTTLKGMEAIAVDLDEQVQISFGSISLLLRFVRPPPGVHVQVLDESDFGFFKIAAVCAMAAIVLIVGLLVVGGPLRRFDGGGLPVPARFARLLIQPEPKKPRPAEEISGVREGAKAKDEEGKFGRKEAKHEEADPSRPGTPIVDPRKREQDRKQVMSAGLLGALGKGSVASNILGPGGLGVGINNALGGLKVGAGLTDAKGVGGLGSRGSGAGGGGTAMGLGGLGTRGDGRGMGGSGSVELAGRGKETTRIVPGKTIVVGGLSKEVIAKIIRSHQSEIKYCYEVELQKNPSLFGKVAVLFIINGSGIVSEAAVSESSLGNSNAEQCMVERIKRWKFPEPQGGGLVSVTFPWVFKPAGGEES
jgi:TonB family protein